MEPRAAHRIVSRVTQFHEVINHRVINPKRVHAALESTHGNAGLVSGHHLGVRAIRGGSNGNTTERGRIARKFTELDSVHKTIRQLFPFRCVQAQCVNILTDPRGINHRHTGVGAATAEVHFRAVHLNANHRGVNLGDQLEKVGGLDGTFHTFGSQRGRYRNGVVVGVEVARSEEECVSTHDEAGPGFNTGHTLFHCFLEGCFSESNH